MVNDKLENLIKMLRLTIRCGNNVNIEIDKSTSEYLLELIEKDVLEHDIPISLNYLQDEINENAK